jgi:hypothetical protein
MKVRYLILSIGLILFLTACKEFLEPSLKNTKVILLAPGEKLESRKYNQSFWWEPVEDALLYRLQIVTPRFDSTSSVVVDTLVKGNKFSITLNPGNYEWRVRSENGSSTGLFSSRKLTILESSLEEQQVQLTSPSNHFITNQSPLVYRWESLFSAAKYRLQIDTNNFADENILVFNNTTPALEFTVPFSKEKLYQWRVRVENDTDQSKWSVISTVLYDHTAPPKTILNSPANKQTVAKPVALQWDVALTASKYELFVFKSDSTSTYNTGFPVTVNGTSYNFNEGATGEKIYWKVRALDEAGNKGLFSDLRNFIIQ